MGFSAGSHLLEQGGGPADPVGHDNEYEPDDKTNGYNDESNESSYESVESQLNPPWIPRSRYKREQKRIKRQRLNVIVNYSSITLNSIKLKF